MPTSDTSDIQNHILDWYDREGRSLPWRAKDKENPNPYHVWLSEVMCQQTTIPAVIPNFQKFTKTWPSVTALANAKQDDVMEAWAGLGYYARARNLYKCAQVVAFEKAGNFPQSRAGLQELPGIGDYTSAAIASIVFNEPAPVVDGNVERVAARIFAIENPLPKSKPEIKRAAETLYKNHTDRPGDLAQAYMDLGATICTPKSPRCLICPVRAYCQAHKKKIAAELPAKDAKKQKPQKHGYFYWIENNKGQILLERRDDSLMLGGMIALPTSEWVKKDEVISSHPVLKDGENMAKSILVRHSFTHFDLELYGKHGVLSDQATIPAHFFWENKDNLRQRGFPSLFKKAVKLMI